MKVTGAGIPGDYNGNEMVDAADYTTWRDALTAGSSLLTDDPTPGTVDESDFLYWRDHFGEALGMGASLGASAGLSSSANTAVPEPASLTLAIIALLSRNLMVSAAARGYTRRRLSNLCS